MIGFLVMFGGVVFAITGPSGRRPGAFRRHAGRRPSAPVKGGGTGSFTSRMEDRFRRRFDE